MMQYQPFFEVHPRALSKNLKTKLKQMLHQLKKLIYGTSQANVIERELKQLYIDYPEYRDKIQYAARSTQSELLKELKTVGRFVDSCEKLTPEERQQAKTYIDGRIQQLKNTKRELILSAFKELRNHMTYCNVSEGNIEQQISHIIKSDCSSPHLEQLTKFWEYKITSGDNRNSKLLIDNLTIKQLQQLSNPLSKLLMYVLDENPD